VAADVVVEYHPVAGMAAALRLDMALERRKAAVAAIAGASAICATRWAATETALAEDMSATATALASAAAADARRGIIAVTYAH
jgi:hypothetical protein